MKRFNLVTKKTYKGRDGEEKAQWLNVGSLVYFPAQGDKPYGFKMELNMFPETKFYVFEQKEKHPKTVEEGAQPEQHFDETQQVDVSNIPF